ncbi:MAG TPA: hypothetical protein VGM59_02900 [Dongiaceae bacterium]
MATTPRREKQTAGNEKATKEAAKKSKSTRPNAARRRKDGTTEIEVLARSHAAAAVAALVAVMEDATATPSARIAAAGALLQWGFGKPASISGTAARAELLKTIERGDTPQLIRLTWATPEAVNDNREEPNKTEPEEPSA